jgi:hypothetical protein
MTIDMLVVVSGYFSFLKTQHQLMSPLIPQSTVYQILSDSSDNIIKASLISAGFVLAGLWFYSFKKHIPAIVLFGLAIVSFKIVLIII